MSKLLGKVFFSLGKSEENLLHKFPELTSYDAETWWTKVNNPVDGKTVLPN